MLAFQSLIVFPSLQFALSTKRLSKNNRLVFALLLVICFALGQYLALAATWEPNLFEVLNVPTSASVRDVKAAYRKLSLEAHPDRGGSEEEFVLISKAHTVLSNEEQRDAYNRFGEEGLHWLETSQDLFTKAWIKLGIAIFVNFVLAFIMTISVSNTNARSYAYATLGIFVAVAVQLRFGQEDPLEFWSSKTRNQKCDALFAVLHTIMASIAVVQRQIYHDAELDLEARLDRIEQQQARILKRIGPPPAAVAARKQDAEEDANLENEKEEETPIKVRKVRPQQQQQAAPNPLFNQPSWVYMLAFMMLQNFLSKD